MASAKMRKNKNGNRVFRFRVMIDGVEYQKTFPGKNDLPIPATWSDKRAKTEAQKQLALFEAECKRGAITNDKRTLEEYCRYVIDYKEATGAIKPLTISEYRYLLKNICASSLGRLRLSDITAKDINGFYKWLSEDGQNKNTGGKLSAKTIKEHHVLIHSVLRHAVKEGILIFNPADNATPPKVKKKEAAYFTQEQIADILKALELEPEFWRALAYVLIGTGMRRGEAAGLKWSDIDFKTGRISILRNVIQSARPIVDTPKTGKGRTITAPLEVIKELECWRRLQSDLLGAVNLSGFVFASEDIQTPVYPSSITRWFAGFSKRHNLPHINPHAFRHTQASILLQTGDIIAASLRLGHAQASTTTDIYGHLMNATDKQAAETIGAALFKKGGL